MNRDELLDKLAMELADWPKSKLWAPELLPKDYQWLQIAPSLPYVSCLIERNIYQDEWLQRRRELINEPDDKDAPEWAEWVAQNSSGGWYFHQQKPDLTNVSWRPKEGSARCAGLGELPTGHDWRKTLRRVKCKEKPVIRQSCDGVNTETVHPDGSVTRTMVHPRSVQGKSLLEKIANIGESLAYTPPIESWMYESPQVFTPFPTEDAASEQDPVNHPRHYMLFPGLESIDVIQRALTPEQFAGFCIGNTLKYRMRAGEKGDAQQDLAKANWYRNKLSEVNGE